MNVLGTEAKLWWLSVPDEIRSPRGIAIIDAIRALSEAFQFAAVPTSLPGPNDGYRFQEGRLIIGDKTIVIKEVVIFNDGISVEVYSNSDDSMVVLEKLLEIGERLGLRKPITPPRMLYNSGIVLELDGNMNKLIANYDSISKMLVETMGIGGVHDVRAIEFSIDPAKLPKQWGQLNPTLFRLERRLGVEHEKNRYFSFANTTTKNHLHILEQIERAV